MVLDIAIKIKFISTEILTIDIVTKELCRNISTQNINVNFIELSLKSQSESLTFWYWSRSSPDYLRGWQNGSSATDRRLWMRWSSWLGTTWQRIQGQTSLHSLLFSPSSSPVAASEKHGPIPTKPARQPQVSLCFPFSYVLLMSPPIPILSTQVEPSTKSITEAKPGQVCWRSGETRHFRSSIPSEKCEY